VGALIVGAALLTAAPAAAYERWFGPYPAATLAPDMRAGAPVKPRFKRTHQYETKNAKTQRPEKISGPLHIVISIKAQRLTLYANGQPVAQSPVSTGVPGHPTPQGVFSIIQKNRFHRSNIYSDAPMPFMQRITWSGVAMHEGRLPGYAASHGCIRLPAAFAQRLWGITRIGARVIIAQDDVPLAEIANPRLMALRPAPKIADAAPPAKIRFATAIISDAPLKGSIDAMNARGDAAAVEKAIDQAVQFEAETYRPGEPLVADLLDKGELATSPKDLLLRAGPISIYISRKLGKLYVRKGLEPVFETPVTIAQADSPLGTHVFTALDAKDGVPRWNVLSLPIDRTVKKGKYLETTTRSGETLRKELIPPVYETQPPGDPHAALERITIPETAVSRIAELMSPGASLIISDLGLSHETGERGTDFIVLTR
jgi:lipoprotein-anchoring transpeptidase ErfK/SrfK